jgi:6-pyruvoyltetrahydropterin/6-carboxytetrahydropterin synthase
MLFELTQAFYFDAAHTLSRQIDTDSSRRIHGHTYHAEVTVRGPANPANGMVLDIGVLRAAIESVRLQLDHHFLDEVPGLGLPTLENLCQFILRCLSSQIPLVSAVLVERRASGDKCLLRI